MYLTTNEARAVLLGAQGLLRAPRNGATKQDVLDIIRRMGALQIDTISVVARSHHFTLWSRLGHYDPAWLNELLAEGALFEYWAHAACFLPIEDFPIYRRGMLDGGSRYRAWMADHPNEVERVLNTLRDHGTARSADFERVDGRARAGWWDWKPEKIALESLYVTGDVMIARRDRNFHRVYALREHVLPGWDDARTVSTGDARRALAVKAVRCLGIAKSRWVPDYFKTPKTGVAALLAALANEGLLGRVEVEGWDEPAYLHPDNESLVHDVASGALQPAATRLLTPFDPVVWDRSRAVELFGFEYKIETYTPASKRRYGYFTLPILHRASLVGRLDAKAHRREGRFEVRSLHLEPGVTASDELVESLSETLVECATWHGTPRVEIIRSDPPRLARLVQRQIDLTGDLLHGS